jgi:dihydroorotase
VKRLLRGARIIDPSQNLDGVLDLLIEDGRIRSLGETTTAGGGGAGIEEWDLTGKIVVPGLVDMHTHLREPGFEYKETIRTGSEAAAAGGFTSIACMANTNPVNDTRSVTEFILRKAREHGIVRVYPVAAISRGLEGKVLSEFGDLKEAGAAAFSDDGKWVADSSLMRQALEYAASFGMPVISHCEDPFLSENGAMNEGRVSTELGLQGIPSIGEEIAVRREIALAEYTGFPVHIAHVSTGGSVRAIREAKKAGIPVTAETAPHYFTLTENLLEGYDTAYKVNPPLRTERDVEAVKEGLADGTIDAIATDHAPHSSIEKDVEFEYASCGIVGLETALGLSLKLVREGVLTMTQLVEKMSLHPARILRIPRGTLKEGAEGDVTVIDPDLFWKVRVDSFRSKSRNSPFHGWPLQGKAVMTLVAGEIRHNEL